MTTINRLSKGIAFSLLMSTSLTSVATTYSAAKEDAERATAIGLGTGVVVGAVVAGPVGAFVVGTIGALIGKDTAQTESLSVMTDSLNEKNAELYALQQAFDQQSAALEMARVTQQQTNMVEASIPTLLSNVQFKTGSVEVEPAFKPQLDLIAHALGNNTSLTIRLTGHADQRGDTQFNQALSMQRALSVKTYLEAKGVNDSQIDVIAVGEQFSKTDTFEGNFFDRKVEMEISPAAQLASTDDQ
ncbi:sortase-associated OmpA-like protein PdsO [Alteromonas sp. KUL49]|uniref:sortase-associated OmpA-like protein PdsO n=1 Tax=Alteromonas sp. KUL49 TaxID=2480798 RepID=UPI00102EE463|nr:sortase-associated OmpA-like protein PdsO [Alteromonas sp. KUL49]TAP37990.1 sortase-associated OmpA-like protein PdsO [Alteromonas sp. KUL49]GEA12863.1 membrane protein [Alteromonas sp. KUL49]